MPMHVSTGAPARAFAVAALFALAGCATPSALAPGTPEAEVIAKFGQPAEVYPLPAPPNARRLAYPIGRLNQQTWMVDVDANGRMLRVQEAIAAERFAQIRIGKDDTTTIRREFGPPWMIRTYTLSGLTAWMYPYLESGWWNSEMSVYFDKSGIVRKVESGPDERFVGGSDHKPD
jgi:hypothetical protein